MDGMKGRLARSLQEVRDRGRRLADLNIELLKAELKRAAAKYGAAIALFVGAAVFAFFGFSFLLATIAVVLDIVLPLWAAMLIVTFLLFLLVAVMALVGKNLITSVKSPAPGKAFAEAQASAQAAKDGARGVVRRRKKATSAAAAAAGPASTAATEAAAHAATDAATEAAAHAATDAGRSAVVASDAASDAAAGAAARPSGNDLKWAGPPASAPPPEQPESPYTPPSATGGDRAPD